ncbi:hypothetical protein V1514DRAFT_159376 [Lipomyces japonicus]|uniref:uncharacterized protein n=1 Tax=Lipomyces japonicus TaxID=56871 RepID=UPI0034CD0B04
MHSSELEQITLEPLTPNERDRKIRNFDLLVLRYETGEYCGRPRGRRGYRRIPLLQVMKEELENPDRFLRFFFAYLASELNKVGVILDKLLSDLNNNLHINRSITPAVSDSLTTRAKDLMSNFFVLFKASVGRTPFLNKSSEFVDFDHVDGVSHRLRRLRHVLLVIFIDVS